MSDNRYFCRLSPFEEEHLEKLGVDFSKFVHDHFYHDMRNNYLKRLKRLQYEVFLILLGMFSIAIAYTGGNFLLYTVFLSIGSINIGLGAILILWEKNNYAQRK